MQRSRHRALRPDVGRLVPRAGLAAASVSLLVLASLALAPPALASHGGSHQPSPSGVDCDWYGSVEHDFHQSDEDNGHATEVDERGSGWSGPSADATCRGTVEYSYTQHQTSPDGLWWHREAEGTGSATYEAGWASWGPPGTFAVSFGADEPVTMTITDSSGGEPGTEQAPAGAQGGCFVPGAETEAERAGFQAVVITCSQIQSGSAGQSWTATIRMRRRECDPTIDSDGDDLADCTEFALQTEPHNPDTDNGGIQDGDEVALGTDPLDRTDDVAPWACADGIDNDGDGTVDSDGGDGGARDPGCNSDADPSEFGQAECDNGKDDDGNLRADFRQDGSGDAGCESLTDPTERIDCATAAKDRNTTTLDVPTRLNVAVAADPHLGTLHMRVPWCMTPVGPRIMTPPDVQPGPSGWWDGTENWLLLGTLEWFGITIDPAEPAVDHGFSAATVTTSLDAKLNAADAILSAVPVGKLFKPLKKSISKYADDLNPLVKRLDKHRSKVRKATKEMEESGVEVRKARARVAEVRQWIADKQRALDAAATEAERRRLRGELAELKKTERAAKAVERRWSLDHQEHIKELRRIKADEEKLARKVDKLLKKIRTLDEKVQKFKKKVREAIDKRVDRIQPGWAREMVRGYVDDIDRKVSGPVDFVSSKVRKLSSDKLLDIVRSGSATSSLVTYLKSTYTETVNKVSNIPIPIWDGNFTVSFDQAGNPSVSDKSDSHGIFTVVAEPTLRQAG